MERNIKTKLLAAVAVCLSLLGCGKEAGGGDSPSGRTDSIGQPIHAENGIVRFFVSEQEGESPRSVLLGGGTHLEAGQTIRVNGMSYALKQSDGGKLYIDVKEAADRVYVATDQSASLEEILIPYSQFQSKTRQSFKESPRYAVYTEATGNLLTLKDPMALLNLKLKGSVNVSSVKVRSLDGKGIAGKGSIQEGKLTLGDALDFAVVNCTENGSFVPLSSAGTSVGVLLAPGAYPGGFEVTVCTSDHRMVRRTLPGGSLGSGEVRTESVDVTPEGDLVFYEGFDNFVWGGNWMGGEQAFGFAPDANTINPVTTLVRDGYADATVKVAYNTPGSSFIQSDVWTTVENSTVGQSHLMGKSYITSRNIADWNYLYRCQEYQGALGVGMGTAYRGILELPALRVQGMWDVRVRFKFSFRRHFFQQFQTILRLSADGAHGNCHFRAQHLCTWERHIINFCTKSPIQLSGDFFDFSTSNRIIRLRRRIADSDWPCTAKCRLNFRPKNLQQLTILCLFQHSRLPFLAFIASFIFVKHEIAV